MKTQNSKASTGSLKGNVFVPLKRNFDHSEAIA